MGRSFVKAATQGPRQLRVQNDPWLTVGEGAAIVRIEFAGICGTDKHSCQGDIVQYGGKRLPLPIIPGHENVGVIEEMGGEILDHDGQPLSVGDRVVVAPNLPCGRCYSCRNHRPYYFCTAKHDYGNNLSAADSPHLFGGWSEYLYALPGSQLFRYPDSLPPELGALIEPMAVTACLDKAKSWSSEWEPFRVGDMVAVLGVGPIGLCHVAKARLLGAGAILATDLSGFRLGVARSFGATEVADAADVTACVRRLTGGRGADVVVDCTGVPVGFRQALDLIREGGMVLEVGNFVDSGEIGINPHRHILVKCARIIGVGGDDLAAYATSIRLIEASRRVMPWEAAITHRFALEDAEDAMAAARGPDSMKVVFQSSAS